LLLSIAILWDVIISYNRSSDIILVDGGMLGIDLLLPLLDGILMVLGMYEWIGLLGIHCFYL
jgi:hypothetical protein